MTPKHREGMGEEENLKKGEEEKGKRTVMFFLTKLSSFKLYVSRLIHKDIYVNSYQT